MIKPILQFKKKNERENLRGRIKDINAITRALAATRAFVESSACKFIGNNKALLLGSWGTGKTHFLCDLTRSQMAAGKMALIVLAKNCKPDPDPLIALCYYTGLTDVFSKLLLHLNDLYKTTGERAKRCLDSSGMPSFWYIYYGRLQRPHLQFEICIF